MNGKLKMLMKKFQKNKSKKQKLMISNPKVQKN